MDNKMLNKESSEKKEENKNECKSNTQNNNYDKKTKAIELAFRYNYISNFNF